MFVTCQVVVNVAKCNWILFIGPVYIYLYFNCWGYM